jgi:hypothetical protein
MDQPWPATYERSISLLATPKIYAARVNLGLWRWHTVFARLTDYHV